MQGNSKLEGSPLAKASRNLPLESLLQQAWLQSQRLKVQRRSTESGSPVDAALLERASSQSSASKSPAPPLLSGADSGRPGDVEGSEKPYVHKTRPEALPADFFRRLAPPELQCFSQKTNVKKSSSSTLNQAKPILSDGCSQDSVDSSKFSCSGEFPIGTLPSLEDNLDAVDFEGLGDVFSEWTGETDPMASTFLEEFLTNEENLEGEKSPTQEGTAYHAMEKEMDDLLVPDGAVHDACDPDVADSERCRSEAEFFSN